MKLLILSIIWFPVTFALLIYSVTNLNHYQENAYQINLSPRYTVQAYNDMDKFNYLLLENKLPDQDIRITVLKKFFSDYRSPLFEASELLVKKADIYGLDYALIPAIAMQESGGCKVIPVDSYNCWGFGIYGDRVVTFDNYDHAIEKVAKTIKETYIKKGLTNATLLEDRWTPSSRGQWSYSVNFYIGKIRQYERNIAAS